MGIKTWKWPPWLEVLEDLGIWLNWVSFDVNDIGECLRFILNIIILIAKNLVIVVIFWNYIWKCRNLTKLDWFFFILNDVMIDLYLYDDGIVFDHDCDSCEIKCIDIKLFVKCRKIEIWIWVWKY
jgi:hypothetical protein